MRIRHALEKFLATSIPLVTLTFLVGCPHRSPVFSPDGRHIVVLAGEEGEKMDEPATQFWLIRRDAETYSPKRLSAPGRSGGQTRYLAATWLDSSRIRVMTVAWNAEDGEPVAGSEASWTVRADTLEWSPFAAPPPSAERTPRRLPVTVGAEDAGTAKALAYPSGDEDLVVVSDTGKVLARLESAELVGPGTGGGFLIYRVDEDTGENVLVSYGGDLKARWRRGFADLAADIARRLGKKTSEIVFNETNTSTPQPSGRTVAVQLIFSDVNWKDGVSGYCAILDAASGELKSVAGATCVPGVPSLLEAKDGTRRAWTVTPSKARGPARTATIRALAVPAGADDETAASQELSGVPMRSVHGYRLDGTGTRFAVSVNAGVPRVLVYPVDAARLAGKAVEIRLQ